MGTTSNFKTSVYQRKQSTVKKQPMEWEQNISDKELMLYGTSTTTKSK